ncbi:hypothetical protein ACSR0Z_08125 [Streptomyces viridosporus]
MGRLVALVASRAAGRSVGGTHSDDSTLPDAQSQQDIEVPRKHDPRTGGHSNRIVPHDGRRPLTAPDAQMSAAVAGLEKLPHVLSAQNPLSAAGSSGGRSGPHVGPLSSDGERAASPPASTSGPRPSTTTTSTEWTTRYGHCGRRAHRSSTAGRSANRPGPPPTTGPAS